nr:NADH dehydrogenase subunit 5 [Chelopistes texanus]
MKIFFEKNWFHLLLLNIFTTCVFLLNFEFKPFILEWKISTIFSWVSWDLCLFFDKVSLLFFSMVSMVSIMVLKYAYSYMFNSKEWSQFIWTLICFILSMLILTSSGSLFWTLIGWDCLGLSSFCLVIFYQSWKSWNSGMATFMYNRFGDMMFFISLLILAFQWNSPSWLGSSESFFSYFLLFGTLTKSAQIPFSAWLPLAMAAPTPVSALVHSSTLVTAGIFVLCRFFSFLDDKSLIFLNFISLMTIILAGTSAMFEYDLKKIIALSTLSHIGFILFFLSIKSQEASLFHMFVHAFFKSLLFMSAGYLIHLESGKQDIRSLSINVFSDPYPWNIFSSAIFSMAGLPFFAGFYSKELMLLFSAKVESPIALISSIGFMLSVCLTCGYSFRLLSFLFSSKSFSFSKKAGLPQSFKLPFFWGGLLSVFSGSIFLWIFLSPFSVSVVILNNPDLKGLLVFSMLLGGFLGFLSNFFFYNSTIFTLSIFLDQKWFIGSLGNLLNVTFFLSSFKMNSSMDLKGLYDEKEKLLIDSWKKSWFWTSWVFTTFSFLWVRAFIVFSSLIIFMIELN